MAISNRVKEATVSFDPAVYIRTDEEAALYFDDALQSGDPSVIAAALGTIVRARGASEVAKASEVSRSAIYKGLTEGGNPTLETMMRVLDHLGVELKARVRV